jgi:AcrR family transcriptional regulator
MTQPAIGLRERKKAERHRSILLHSRQLFDRDGFDATSIEGIARAVDVAVGTIYKFFPTKIDILMSLLREDVESTIHAAPRINTEVTKDPLQGIYLLLKQELEALEAVPKQLLALATAHAVATGQTTETGRLYAEADKFLSNKVRALLDEYQIEGALHEKIDIDTLSDLIYDTASGGELAWLAGEHAGIEQVLARLPVFLAIIFAGVQALAEKPECGKRTGTGSRCAG